MLERHALRHLERYPSSRANLRRVLARRAEVCCDHHGDDCGAADASIEAVLERLTELGLLDDRRYAAAQARRMRARGASRRRIEVSLHERGVPSDIALDVLGDEGEGSDADRVAAGIYARRRRLGPHRTDPGRRAERRDRDLAALARAGFGYAVASAVVDARPGADDELPTP
jgi:regulatory protein